MSASTSRTGSPFVRLAALLGVLVLVCVPSLTRAGQRLETSSRAPSFRNVDCPPKKTADTSVQSVLTTAIDVSEAAPAVKPVPSTDTAPPPSRLLAVPRPLRAPPSPLLS